MITVHKVQVRRRRLGWWPRRRWCAECEACGPLISGRAWAPVLDAAIEHTELGA